MTTQGADLDAMGSLRRTHGCGSLTQVQVGDEVVVAGWVHRRRDHGGVIFVDLRDRDGVGVSVPLPRGGPGGESAQMGRLRRMVIADVLMAVSAAVRAVRKARNEV